MRVSAPNELVRDVAPGLREGRDLALELPRLRTRVAAEGDEQWLAGAGGLGLRRGVVGVPGALGERGGGDEEEVKEKAHGFRSFEIFSLVARLDRERLASEYSYSFSDLPEAFYEYWSRPSG